MELKIEVLVKENILFRKHGTTAVRADSVDLVVYQQMRILIWNKLVAVSGIRERFRRIMERGKLKTLSLHAKSIVLRGQDDIPRADVIAALLRFYHRLVFLRNGRMVNAVFRVILKIDIARLRSLGKIFKRFKAGAQDKFHRKARNLRHQHIEMPLRVNGNIDAARAHGIDHL